MRVIQGKLYRISSQIASITHYVECADEKELMEYVVKNYYGTPVNVVYMTLYGKTPKVAIYTDPYYKQLVKNRQAFK